jgi:cell division protein FtsQ
MLGTFYVKEAGNFQNNIKNCLAFILNKTNMTLQNVYLEGQKHTKNQQIVSAINLKIGQPIMSVPINEIKDSLESISWVKYAMVERQLPDSLYINIVEREAIAFWQNGGKLYLIDDEGSPILEQDLLAYKDLIILIGDDAPLNVNSLLQMISKNKELYKQVSSATRVGERRWNIKFSNGLEIMLPEERPEKSWDYVIKLYENKNLFAKGTSVVDLRIPDRLYIK